MKQNEYSARKFARPTPQELEQQKQVAKERSRFAAEFNQTLAKGDCDAPHAFSFDGSIKQPKIGKRYIDVPGWIWTAKMAAAEGRRRDMYLRGLPVPSYYDMLDECAR